MTSVHHVGDCRDQLRLGACTISALLRSGISMDKLEAHIPFLGALLNRFIAPN